MTAAINSTGAGKRGYPTKSSVPETQASTQRRARERSVAIQTLLLVRKSKSSSVRSEERVSRNAETELVCRLLLEIKRVADGNDLAAIERAIEAAVAETERPSFIGVRTSLGYASPHQAGTA